MVSRQNYTREICDKKDETFTHKMTKYFSLRYIQHITIYVTIVYKFGIKQETINMF